MEVEGYYEIISTIEIAKELYDMGRQDLIQSCFSDEIFYDYYYENMLEVIGSVFTHSYNNYDDEYDCEVYIFMDEVISDYYNMAYEYGKKHKLPHDSNPYVTAAGNAVRHWLSYCYSLDWSLLGYTKKKSTARQSKLIVRFGICDCCGFDRLAYGLLQVYKWFANECAKFKNTIEIQNKEKEMMIAA